MRLSDNELKRRIDLACCVLMDGIKECVGESKLKEIIRQREVIKQALKDKKHLREKQKTDGVIIGLKPLTLFTRRR